MKQVLSFLLKQQYEAKTQNYNHIIEQVMDTIEQQDIFQIIQQLILKNNNQLIKQLLVQINLSTFNEKQLTYIYISIINQHKNQLVYNIKAGQQSSYQIDQMDPNDLLILSKLQYNIGNCMSTLLLHLVCPTLINSNDNIIQLFNKIISHENNDNYLSDFIKTDIVPQFTDIDIETNSIQAPTEIGTALLGFSINSQNAFLILQILLWQIRVVNKNKHTITVRQKICFTLLLQQCVDQLCSHQQNQNKGQQQILIYIRNNQNTFANIFDIIINWYSEFSSQGFIETTFQTQDTISKVYTYVFCNICLKIIPIFIQSTVVLFQRISSLLQLLHYSFDQLKNDITLSETSLQMYYFIIQLKSQSYLCQNTRYSDIRYLLLHNLYLLIQNIPTFIQLRYSQEQALKQQEAGQLDVQPQQFNNIILEKAIDEIYNMQQVIEQCIYDILYKQLQKYQLIKIEQFHFASLMIGYLVLYDVYQSKQHIYVQISEDNMELVVNMVNTIYGKNWKIINVIYNYVLLFLKVELSMLQMQYQKQHNVTTHYINYNKYINLLDNLVHYKRKYLDGHILTQQIYDNIISSIIYNLCIYIYKTIELNINFSFPIGQYMTDLQSIIQFYRKNNIQIRQLYINQYLGYHVGHYIFYIMINLQLKQQQAIQSIIYIFQEIINDLNDYKPDIHTYKFLGYSVLQQNKQKQISIVTQSDQHDNKYEHLLKIMRHHIEALWDASQHYNGINQLNIDIFEKIIQGLKYKLFNENKCHEITINNMQQLISQGTMNKSQENAFIILIIYFLLDFSNFVEPNINKFICRTVTHYYIKNNLLFDLFSFIFYSFNMENFILDTKYSLIEYHGLSGEAIQVFQFLLWNNQSKMLIWLISSLNLDVILQFKEFCRLYNANKQFITVFLQALQHPCIYDLLYVPTIFDNIINILNDDVIEINDLFVTVEQYVKILCELNNIAQKQDLCRVQQHIEQILQLLYKRVSSHNVYNDNTNNQNIKISCWNPEQIYLNILYLYNAQIHPQDQLIVQKSQIIFQQYASQLINIFLYITKYYNLTLQVQKQILEIGFKSIMHVVDEVTLQYFQMQIHLRLIIMIAKFFESQQTYECYQLILQSLTNMWAQYNDIQQQCYRYVVVSSLAMLDFQWMKLISLQKEHLRHFDKEYQIQHQDKQISTQKSESESKSCTEELKSSTCLPLLPIINNKTQYIRILNDYQYINRILSQNDIKQQIQYFDHDSFQLLSIVIPTLVNNTLYKSVHLVQHIHLIQSQREFIAENENYDVVTGFIQCFTTQQIIKICENCIKYSPITLINCYPYLSNVYTKLLEQTDHSLHLLSITLQQLFKVQSLDHVEIILKGSMELIQKQSEEFYKQVQEYLFTNQKNILRVFQTLIQLNSDENNVFDIFICKYIQDFQNSIFHHAGNSQSINDSKYSFYVYEYYVLVNDIIQVQSYNFAFTKIMQQNNKIEQILIILVLILSENALFQFKDINYQLINTFLKFQGKQQIKPLQLDSYNAKCRQFEDIKQIFYHIKSNMLIDIQYILNMLENMMKENTNTYKHHLLVFTTSLFMLTNISDYKLTAHMSQLMQMSECCNQATDSFMLMILIVEYSIQILEFIQLQNHYEKYEQQCLKIYKIIADIYLNHTFNLNNQIYQTIIINILNIFLSGYFQTIQANFNEIRPKIIDKSIIYLNIIFQDYLQQQQHLVLVCLDVLQKFYNREDNVLNFINNNFHYFILIEQTHEFLIKFLGKIDYQTNYNQVETSVLKHHNAITQYLVNANLSEKVCNNLITVFNNGWNIRISNKVIQLFAELIRIAGQSSLDLLTCLQNNEYVQEINEIVINLIELEQQQ